MRWHGAIGFSTTEEKSLSVYTQTITERIYTGDVYHLTSRRQVGSGVNDNLTLSQELSIVADPYALTHYSQIAYASLDGVRWRITNVVVERPRLRLTFGEVWHGPIGETIGAGQTVAGNSYGL